MTIRTTELVMTVFLAAVSIALMVKSSEQNIGWIKGSGPGAGMWPFWLSVGMLICCLLNLLRWFQGKTAESQNWEPYMTRQGVKVILPTFIALVALLVGTHIIGIYFSVFLFLFFFVRIMGGHTWLVSLPLMAGAPVVIFVFFEWALRVQLPKGISEPLFYPIYDLIY